jgi:hypothetical protein
VAAGLATAMRTAWGAPASSPMITQLSQPCRSISSTPRATIAPGVKVVAGSPPTPGASNDATCAHSSSSGLIFHSTSVTVGTSRIWGRSIAGGRYRPTSSLACACQGIALENGKGPR